MILARELIFAWVRALFRQRPQRAMTWLQARRYAAQAGIAISREANPERHAEFMAWNVIDRLPNGWSQQTMTEAILASARHHAALLAD